MNRLFRSKRKKAFTLIELLVVIAIIALLAAILAPAVTKALLKGQVAQTVNNGRSLYLLFFSKQMDNPLGLQTSGNTAAWPTQAEGFQDSTEYFATIITNASFGLNYSFFSAPGIRNANSEQEFLDTQLRNAWCITLDVDESFKMGSPVFFTQNILLTGADLLFWEGLTDGARPYGNRAAVVVAYGGSTIPLDPDTALGTNFNPIGTAGIALYPRNGQL